MTSYLQHISRYTESCLKLITQFKSSLTTLDRAFDLTTFMSELKLNCPSAYHRLHEIGMPATMEHETAKGNNAKGSEAKAVAKVVHSFVTLMDALKLGLVTVEHVHPLLSELLRNINRASNVPQGIRESIKSWLIALNKRRPTDALTEEEAETMARQVEEAHDQFYQSISA
mgnify:CR=1 FL=1